MAITTTNFVDVEHTDDDGNRTYMVTYQVQTNSTSDGPVTIKNNVSLPSKGDSFNVMGDTDAGAILTSRRVKLIKVRDSYKDWLVFDTYKTFAIGLPGEELNVNTPLEMPPRWSGSFIQFSRPYVQSSTGGEIRNKAGHMFVDPPVVGDDSRMSIVVEQNLSSLSVATWASFRDAINSATFWGFAKFQLKVQSITWEKAYFEGVAYYPVRWELHVQDDSTHGWRQQIVNAGWREKDGTEIKKGTPPTRPALPWKLTTAGVAVSSSTVSANYITAKLYREKSFATLGVPTVLGGDT